MSYQGIHSFADILTMMQIARNKLMRGDKEDIVLGQLLSKANDVVKDDFSKITTRKDLRKK